MQIKEFEALTLKECLQQVRTAMGPDAVILETRKFRKGGVLGIGARDAVAIVAATGITVTSDLPQNREDRHDKISSQPVAATTQISHRDTETPVSAERQGDLPGSATQRRKASDGAANGRTAQSDVDCGGEFEAHAAPAEELVVPRSAVAARLAARGVYGNRRTDHDERARLAAEPARSDVAAAPLGRRADNHASESGKISTLPPRSGGGASRQDAGAAAKALIPSNGTATKPIAGFAPEPILRHGAKEDDRFSYLEHAMGEIRECLVALQREQHANHDRTVSAVVSAVAPAISAVNAAGFGTLADDVQHKFADLQKRMKEMGVSDELIQELFDQLPDMSAWSEQAQQALAVSALKDLIARRVSNCSAIQLTPGQLKAVALIGSTGVGKTTTIAKLAAHFALMQGKRVALLTVDTYRIAAVEQLKTYSQIIDIPLSVAYNHAEVPPIIEKYADYDLLLIDTAGRSQKHIMQVGELKSLLEAVNCETHLVLSAPIKEQDMMEAARRFSAARVDRLIFSKLDETSSYGTLLNVADRTGIPLSYLTTGQKVPEDLEVAEGSKLAGLILD